MKFQKMLKSLKTEEELVTLAARLMKENVWEPVADMVLDYCNELGGCGLEDAVYDRAWGIANNC